MAHPDNLSSVIWQLGDPWRDLRDEIVAAGTTTIVTAHLTTHILDLGEHRTTRLPSLLGSKLKEDGNERTLVEVEIATPCGLVTRCDPIERSQLSTPLLLVLRGVHPDWMPAYLLQLAETADHLRRGLSPLHPPGPCGAFYCPAPATPRAHRPAVSPPATAIRQATNPCGEAPGRFGEPGCHTAPLDQPSWARWHDFSSDG